MSLRPDESDHTRLLRKLVGGKDQDPLKLVFKPRQTVLSRESTQIGEYVYHPIVRHLGPFEAKVNKTLIQP
jgi:hypothetical protein